MVIRVFLLIFSLALWTPGFAQNDQTLPTELGRILDGHNLDYAGLSLLVQEVGAAQPLLALNLETPRNPASTIKLVTTYVALEKLGPAHTWTTRAFANGPLRDGVLDGDLVFQGGGDPYLITEKYWHFLRELRQRGVRHITGDLVIDDSYFEVVEEDPGAFDGQPYRTYNVSPSAFLVNFKAVRFGFHAEPGNDVLISVDPELSNIRIDNRLRTRNGGCFGFQRGIAFHLPNGLDNGRVVFDGRFPHACKEYALWRTVLNHRDFAYGAFVPLWQNMGGSLDGAVRSGMAPEDGEPIVEHESPALAEIIRSVNKFSNNVMTRHLLLTLGAETFETPGTETKGLRALTDWLSAQGLDMPELHMSNGAGLSRETRISAGSMGRMLLSAWRSPYMPEFVASMPLSGMDGTIRRRFQGDRVRGRLHAKTGRLDHVYALAGFFISASGKTYVVVSMHNDRDVHRGPGEELQNALLNWIARR